jgi:hypothetical protein
MHYPLRKFLCADALILSVYHLFQKIPDPRELSNITPSRSLMY